MGVEIGAAGGMVDRSMEQRDAPFPVLPPEQQILQEEEVRTPPRREAREHESQRATEHQLPPSGTQVVPQNRRSDDWSPRNALENTVARMLQCSPSGPVCCTWPGGLIWDVIPV